MEESNTCSLIIISIKHINILVSFVTQDFHFYHSLQMISCQMSGANKWHMSNGSTYGCIFIYPSFRFVTLISVDLLYHIYMLILLKVLILFTNWRNIYSYLWVKRTHQFYKEQFYFAFPSYSMSWTISWCRILSPALCKISVCYELISWCCAVNPEHQSLWLYTCSSVTDRVTSPNSHQIHQMYPWTVAE